MTKSKGERFKAEVIDEIMKEYKGPENFCELMKEWKKAVINRGLEGEIDYHLGYKKHNKAPDENKRNGHFEKTVSTENGEVTINVPRDRKSEFEPTLIKKGKRRLEGFDEKILSMYARGMSMQDIREHMEEIYGTEVSAELISNVTEEVADEVKVWQNRPLDKSYPIAYMDALFVKIKENNQILNKAIYVATGVTMEGVKEVLGLWSAKSEGAKFWLSVITDLKNRGVEKIYIACVDGLSGFEEAIHAVFPKTVVQLCIVHLIRNCLKYVSYKDRKEVAADLKPIYKALNDKLASEALEVFSKKWDDKYPMISNLWLRHWPGIIPFLAHPEYIRKAIYTTNAIESINSQIRKIIRSKGCFPNDEAAIKLIFLTLKNAQKKWTMPIRDWPLALNQFTIMYDNIF